MLETNLLDVIIHMISWNACNISNNKAEVFQPATKEEYISDDIASNCGILKILDVKFGALRQRTAFPTSRVLARVKSTKRE